MKSKFSSIVSVKRQILDRFEIKLANSRAKVANLELVLHKAKQNLLEFSTAKSGNINELRQELKILEIMRNDVKQHTENLSLAQKELLHFTHQYKNASLDFEKMKFLEQDDISKSIKAIKHKESLELDEFATMKFSLKRAEN